MLSAAERPTRIHRLRDRHSHRLNPRVVVQPALEPRSSDIQTQATSFHRRPAIPDNYTDTLLALTSRQIVASTARLTFPVPACSASLRKVSGGTHELRVGAGDLESIRSVHADGQSSNRRTVVLTPCCDHLICLTSTAFHLYYGAIAHWHHLICG